MRSVADQVARVLSLSEPLFEQPVGQRRHIRYRAEDVGAGMWHTAGGEIPVLAFPRNPVSVFVSAWVYLHPLLRKMAGHSPEDLQVKTSRMWVKSGWQKKVGRAQYALVTITRHGVELASRLGSGSHAIASLHRADGLAVLPVESQGVADGEEVDVISTC